MFKEVEKNINSIIKLAAPAQRALASAGIKTLKQLSKYSEEEIKTSWNGKKRDTKNRTSFKR